MKLSNHPILSTLKQQNPVPLMQATTQYQRVNGTTDGSIYFYAAETLDGLRIAFKISYGYKLTLRMEAENQHTLVAAMSSLDCSVDPTKLAKSYQSVHLSCQNRILLVKTISSMLGALGPFSTPPVEAKLVAQLAEGGL